MADAVKKVVLAYSGGLDTSIILKWLQETYGCEVVTFTADLGQGEELEPARRKAELLGVSRRTSSSTTCARSSSATSSSRCSAPTRSTRALYLLGTSIARPLIAKRQIEIAREAGADAVATAPPARATTRCASSSATTRSSPTSRSSRPGASGTSTVAHRAARLRREAPDPDRQGQARRGAVLDRRQPAAHLVRGQGARGPVRAKPPKYVYQRTVAPEAGARQARRTSRSSSSAATRSRSTARSCRRRRC